MPPGPAGQAMDETGRETCKLLGAAASDARPSNVTPLRPQLPSRPRRSRPGRFVVPGLGGLPRGHLAAILLVSLLLVTPGCSGGDAPDASVASTTHSAGKSIRIVFRLPGDDIGSKDDRLALEDIGNAFMRHGVADVVRTEFGMGRMDITIRTRVELSDDSIGRTILEEYPEAKYWIEVPKE